MWVCPSEGKTKIFFIGEERMKRTFKKVLSTVVASLFVLQSASLATVGIGATGTNEVLKSTPTLDGTKDEAYAASWGYTDTVSWGSVDFSFLYDDEYLYVYADIKNSTKGAYDALDMALMVTDNPNNNWTDVHTSTEVVSNPFWTDGTAMACRHYTNIMDYVETGDNLGWQPGQAPKGATHQGETPASEYSLTATNTGAILEYRIKNTKGAFVKGATVSFAATAGLDGWTALWNATDYTTFVLGAKYSPTHTHVYEDEFTVDTPATCSMAGSKSRHCVDYDECNGVTDITPIPKTAHDIVDGTCSVCGQKIVLQETAKVDGNIEGAYKKSAQINLDLSVINSNFAGGASYADEPKQVSGATAYFLWDNDNIYVAVDVKDPTGGLLPDAWSQYGQDSMKYAESVIVSIFRDVNMQGEAAGIRVNAYQPFAFKEGSNGSDLGAGWSAAAGYLKNNTKYAVSTYDGGYVVEYALDGTKLAEGNKYAVNLGVSDVVDYSLNAYGGVSKLYNIGHDWSYPVDGTIELSGQKYNHTHVWESDYTIDVEPTCTKMGVKSIHCVDYAECGGVDSRTEIPKLAHTAGELTTTEPTCVEQGKVTSVCTVCGNPFTVETTPALGHTTTSGKCERCGEYVNAPSKVPYVTAAVDGTKDAAYDSGAKYYVNGATAYVVYDKDYFYVYIEADDAENVAYFTIGNPDKTDNVGPFWSNTAEIKFDFTAKNLWTTDSFACSIFNQNGASTFADNISVDTGATLIAKAGVDYAFADSKNAVELKIHIGEGYAPNNYIGRAYVGNSIYNIGLGTEENGINLKNYGGNLTVAVLNGALTNIVLDSCLGGCVNTERVVTVEPTCTAVGTSVEKCTVCGAEVEGSAVEIPKLGHTWTYLDEEINVAPSCTETGTAFGRYCTVCTEHEFAEDLGEEYFVIPALGHDYEYTCAPNQTQTNYRKGHIGTCKVCQDVTELIAHTPDELGICSVCGGNVNLIMSRYSVSLADVLTLNIKIDKTNVEAYDSFYVKFVDHFNGTEIVDTVEGYELEGTRYVFKYGTPPQRAIDDIDVYVCGVKNGETYTGTYRTLNIKDYIYDELNTISDNSLKRVYVHLLDYIAEAQRVVDYNVNSLANAELTEEWKSLRLPEDKNYTKIAGTRVNEGTSGVTYKTRSLYCSDAVSFKYNFIINDAKYNPDNIKVVVKFAEDGRIMKEYTGSDIIYDSVNDRHYVIVGLIAQHMSKALEVNVYTLDGTLLTNKTLTNSIESMVAEEDKGVLTDMLDAMMQYGRAAAKYVNG